MKMGTCRYMCPGMGPGPEQWSSGTVNLLEERLLTWTALAKAYLQSAKHFMAMI